MSNWLKLEGDVCAVTGALGGMGVEICREFAHNGANVVLLDLDEEKVKAAAADLATEFGIHAEGYKMNATDEAEVQAAVDATIADFGRVDVLVNTAGILRFAAMEDLPLSDWEQVLNVNLTGYFITSQRFGREMIKAGVNMMSKMLAAEWGPTASVPTASSPASSRPPCRQAFTPTPRSRRAAAVSSPRVASARSAISPTPSCSWRPSARTLPPATPSRSMAVSPI